MGDFNFDHGERRSFGLKYWMMEMLTRKEMTGAMLIDEISKLSLGYWKPSPGSIYPILKVAADSGYLKTRTHKGKKFYSLTQKGIEHFGNFKMAMSPFAMFAKKPSRNDSVEESVDAIESNVNYLMDNVELLKADRKSRAKVKELAKELLKQVG